MRVESHGAEPLRIGGLRQSTRHRPDFRRMVDRMNHRICWRACLTIPWLLMVYGIFLFLSLNFNAAYAEETISPSPPRSFAQLSGVFAGSAFKITMESRFGSAISSLTWRGKEFINSFDHGRELQSAVSFNGWGECFNPTEAGSAADGTGGTTTSLITRWVVAKTSIMTTSRMAFWLAPGSTSIGCPHGMHAMNTSPVSDITLTKKVQIAPDGVLNAIDHTVTFHIPRAFRHAVFAALTAYIPPEFDHFWTFDPATDVLAPLSAGPGEQSLPIIFATPSGDFAFGVYSSELPQARWPHLGYGRFDFRSLTRRPGSANVKWNCVFRENDIKPGDYSFRCTSIFGTLKDVERAMVVLHSKRSR